MWYEFSIGEVKKFKDTAAGGIPSVCRFCTAVRLIRGIAAPMEVADGYGECPANPCIVTARNRLGVVLAYLFLKEGHYV
jgi:hypothetical protein